jgi:putative ATP-dependent endonuclease of OLD family
MVSGSDIGPRLILGCDEPELHQHPPQARHLGDVLTRLSEKNSQVIVSTHSPHLISGDRFADIRLIRKNLISRSATVSHVTIEALAATIGDARQEAPAIPSAATLKMRQALMPSLNEMFFTRVVVLVEGLEDVAYIATYAELLGLGGDLRRLGCHMIAVEGKSRMLHPLAVAKHLGIPTFTVFDADSGVENAGHRKKHENDNRAILLMRGHVAQDVMPAETFWARDTVMWSRDIGQTVRKEFGNGATQVLEKTRESYGHDGGLEKSTTFIAEYVGEAWVRGMRSDSLERLIKSIVDFGQRPWPEG